MIFTVHQAKTQLSKLIALAEAGEEVVIARGDKPVVTVRSVAGMANTSTAPAPPRVPGRLRGKLGWSDTFFDPLPDDELTLWDGESD